MNREVNVTKRVRTAGGLRYCPVVLAANSRVRQDVVMVDGKQERHPEGSYYISWHVGSRCVRKAVGTVAADANAQRIRKEAELNAVNHGVLSRREPSSNQKRALAAAVARYLLEPNSAKNRKLWPRTPSRSTTLPSPATSRTWRKSIA